MRFADIRTEDNLQYSYRPVLAGSVNFMVRAPNDAHIALTSGPEETAPIIEIFIGGWGNTKSVIRRNREKPEKAEVRTGGILNENEFRSFWISWSDAGLIQAGREGDSEPFISWQDYDLFPVTHVGVCTGWGATGTWKIDGHQGEINTEDNLEYAFKPVMSGQLEFEFCGPHDCHVAFTSGSTETDPMYEVLIGGWNNSKSVIRYRREKPDKVTVDSPDICDGVRFSKFIIQWKAGKIAVRIGNEFNPALMEWTDENPFPITHYGICTGWGATGRWIVPATSAGNTSNITASPLTGAPEAYTVAPSAPSMTIGGGTWVDAKDGELPPKAFMGGQDGESQYVARAKHEGALIPGKFVPSHGLCYVAWGGGEHSKDEYQVLCDFRGVWVATSGCHVPHGAFPGGSSEDGEPLYIGRVQHEDALTIGKVQGSHGICYISYGGDELGFQDYEILVQK